MYKAGRFQGDRSKVEDVVSFVQGEIEELERSFHDLDSVLLVKQHVVPTKLLEGMVVYADGSDWDPGDGEGFYGYINGVWDKLNHDGADLSDFVVGPANATDLAAARFDLATGKLIQDSVLLVADTTGSLSRSGNGGIPVQGTNTNDSAAAGYYGEHTQSTVARGSALAMSNGVAMNITSLSLTAGDWEVLGVGQFIQPVTSSTYELVSISTTSATVDAAADRSVGHVRTSVAELPDGAIDHTVTITSRVSLSGTTTVYLVAQSGFSGGRNVWGFMSARRMR